ncbi:Dyp-type peroxidase [Stenotrophomonas sp. G106K1]|uniref:Dyp-type peroxidase n=1 Tax=Stenotrophomonas sp. G106K1 TaxID=3134792 RepID=UPI0030F476D4
MSYATPQAPEPQPIDAPLSICASFLVLTIERDTSSLSTVRSVIGSLDDLIKNVLVRDLTGTFTCNLGIGADVWGPLFGTAPPAELRPFREIRGAAHTAVSTPGDLLFHIRARSMDLIVAFQQMLLECLEGSVAGQDDVSGFRYFDGRDLLEFVDGTANPVGLALPEATIVGTEDPAHAGGSYVVTQKYLHDLKAWKGLGTELQEQIIGRRKFTNVELPDAAEADQKSHKTLCTITKDGIEHDILRDNMPFARPSSGEYGTYFIGYSRHLWVVEQMLERMFIGNPPPLHDRILDFSRAVTGNVFFVPSRNALAAMAD